MHKCRAVLLVVLCPPADVVGPAPKYALDGLYAMLAVLLGVNTYNERQALDSIIRTKQRAQAADGSSSSSQGQPAGADDNGSSQSDKAMPERSSTQ